MLSSQATAVVFEQPGELSVRRVGLAALGDQDCRVDVAFSGISSGTERLLWRGEMPAFPGLSYPLVPGYESVGQVAEAGAGCALQRGDWVFVPGSRGYTDVQGLFGGASRQLVVDSRRTTPLRQALGAEGTLLALAATALRAVQRGPEGQLPELVIGHGVLGRLVARITLALGGAAPVVWEREPRRRGGAKGYAVVDPAEDERRDYGLICDVSGANGLLDTLIGCLAPGGCVVLAGFYHAPVSFAFPPAFMREVQLRISAEWQQQDLAQVLDLLDTGRLSLDGLITHRAAAEDAASAYRSAFEDVDCVKMVLDWRQLS